MSADQVDDIEYAEDLLFAFAAALRKFVELEDAGDFTDLVNEVRPVLDQIGDYCRPTCGFVDEGECHDDCCGCPCGHEAEPGPDSSENWTFDTH